MKIDHFEDFFWWELKLVFSEELEESLLWKFDSLGLKNFAIEHKPDNSLKKTCRVWFPSYEWSTKNRIELEITLKGLTKVFDKSQLHTQWEKVVDEDWSKSWKKFWRPDPIGENILILPSWLKQPEKFSNRITLKLDPGSAFGTGGHPTTRLCLEAIERHSPIGMRVADIGCGSGILGIASLLLGAEKVSAVDIDSLSVRATLENRDLNNLSAKKLSVSLGSIEVLEKKLKNSKVDLLVCNTLAPIIKKLAPNFFKITSPSSHLLLSGLLVQQVPDITSVLAKLGWEKIDSYTSKNWALIHLCRNFS